METVWIVDDDRSIRWVLEKALARENISHRSFESAVDAGAALKQLTRPPKVLVSDIRMPGESGLSLLEKAKARFPDMPVIIMTAYSDLDSAVSAFQGGAFEYLPKPFDLEQALGLVRRAIEQGEGTATDGSHFPTRCESICIHSDTPNALDIARVVRAAIAPYSEKRT